MLTSMGGLPPKWKPFVKGTCARGQLPRGQFWSECIQEETREIASTSKEMEEEQVLAAIIGKRRGKWNKGKKGIKTVQKPNIKKDKSNPKCFNCGKLGHFVGECWKKGKGKHGASIAKEKHAPEKKKFGKITFLLILSQVLFQTAMYD